jgi:hypothetical protein
MKATDQRAFMRYAIRIHGLIHDYEQSYVDGARRPLYPLLQSWVSHPDLTREEHYVRGKHFNIGLSLVILAGVYFIVREYLPGLYAATLVLVTAFTVFIFKAAYFPFMFSVSYSIAKQPSRHILIPSTNLRLQLSDLSHLSVLCVLAFDMYFILTERIVTMYAGG